MATFLNHVAIATPRNGTTTHTVTPSSGTVVAGTLFTPTAGRFLLCIVHGSVTSYGTGPGNPPTGWSEGAEIVNSTGLYVWYRESAAGGDSFTVTHNASNYPVLFHFFEFEPGTTIGPTNTASLIAEDAPNPTITGLTGTNFLMSVLGRVVVSGNSAMSGVWDVGTEILDTFEPFSTTSGYWTGITYVEDSTASSWTPTCDSTITGGTHSSAEGVTLSLKVGGEEETTGDITYVGESHNTYAGGRTVTTVDAVPGIADGDYMTMTLLFGRGDLTPVDLRPAGWLDVPGLAQPATESQAEFYVRMYTWYKFASSEPASYTLNHPAVTASTQLSIVAYRGVDPTTPFDVAPSYFALSTSQTNAPITVPGVTTATDGAMITWFQHGWGDSADNLFPPTCTGLTFTERFDVPVLIYGADGVKTTAGATGNVTQAATNSNDGAPRVAQIIALRPAPSASVAAYTELEWNIGVQSPAVSTEVYEFRVQDGATPLASYPVTAQLTIGSGVATAAIPTAILQLAGRSPEGEGPPSNPIVIENALTGYAASNWQISGIGDSGALGFTTAMSVQAGGTLDFKIHSGGTAYTLEIIRLGWYGGTGARLITTINHPAGATQPEGTLRTQGEGGVGSRDCSNWTVTDTWTAPVDACHGVYLGVIKRSGQGTFGHVGPFVVHTDYSTENPIVVKLSDMTWRAYNSMGTLAAPITGKSLYGPEGTPPAGGSGVFAQGSRAWDVTYDAPLVTNSGVPQTAYWNGEQPVHTWLERNGYDVSYVSCLDVEANPSILSYRTAIVSLGHDEYWSQTIRDAWDAAIATGANAIVMSGNTMLWRVRMDGRRMICYKNSHSLDGTGSGIDPVTWTGTFRDTRWSSRSPENRSIGTMFVANGIRADEIIVPGTYASEPLWRNTTVAALSSGSGSEHAWAGATPTAEPTDGNNYELGTWFSLFQPTVITGVRIWNPGLIAPQGGANRTATLWSHDGAGLSPVVLRTVDLPDLLPSGWSEHLFATPYSAPTGVNYMISYFVDGTGSAPGADYGRVVNGLDGVVDTAYVRLEQGFYRITGTPGTIPNTEQPHFYGVDIVYETTGGAPATETLKADCLGMEWDSYEPYYANSMRYPAGLKLLSNASYNLTAGGASNENGSIYNVPINPAKHYIVAFKKGTSLVVNFGTNQWGWGLSDFHARGTSGENTTMKQATVNLLADMGLQPGSIQSGLTPATLTAWSFPTASTMSTTPSVTLGVGVASQLAATTTWSNGITTDNADYVTWGTSNSAVATVSATGLVTAVGAGTATITGTYGSLSDATAVTVTAGSVADTYTPIGYSYTGTNFGPGTAISVGVRFSKKTTPASVYVTGVRWWRSTTSQSSAPVAYLAAVGGSTLATQTSAFGAGAPGAAGWEELTFATPIQITNTGEHVVWVWLPSGGYSAVPNFFDSFPVSSQLGLFQSASTLVSRFEQPPTGTNGNTQPPTNFNGSHYLVEPLVVETLDTGATAAIPTATLRLGPQTPAAVGSGDAAATVPVVTMRIGPQPVATAVTGSATAAIPTATLVLDGRLVQVSGADITVEIPTAIIQIGPRLPAAAGTGGATAAIPTVTASIGPRSPTAAGTDAATVAIPAASLRLGGQPVTGTVSTTALIPTAVMRITTRVPAPAGTGTTSATVPLALLLLVGRLPGNGAMAAILTCQITGPAVRRLVTGPALEQIDVTGPSNEPSESVAGPALSRTPDGPALITRMTDGPGIQARSVEGPELSRDVTGPAVEEKYVLTGPGACD